MNPILKYTDVDLNKIKVLAPISGKYSVGSFQKCAYKYAHAKNPDGSLRIEFCKVKCSQIRKSKNDKDDSTEQDGQQKKKYDQYYLYVTFDLKDPEIGSSTTEFVKFLDKLHLKLGELHMPHKRKGADNLDKFFMVDADTDHATLGQAIFASSIIWDTDLASGERYEENNPSKSFNLLYGHNKETGEEYKARFKYPDGTDIDWEILKNSNFEGYPVVNFSNSYYGGKDITTQTRIISMIITKITEVEYTDLQQDTIDMINKNDPNASKIVRDQVTSIANLLAQRKNISSAGPVSLSMTSNDLSNVGVDNTPLTDIPYTSNVR